MADKKISALTGATTPLAGTEVLPIVQSGATVKVAVSDLTAGRAISATQITLTTGNVIVASGQGIDFSATSHPAGMTSELLNDYEEGTWTPTLIPETGSFTSTTYQTTVNGRYTKIGNVVHIQGFVGTSAVNTAGGSNAMAIGGLPFTVKANSSGKYDSYCFVGIAETSGWATHQPSSISALPNSTVMYTYYRALANGATNAVLVSNVATGASGNQMFFGGTYIAA
jgi:hypothetical protein